MMQQRLLSAFFLLQRLHRSSRWWKGPGGGRFNSPFTWWVERPLKRSTQRSEVTTYARRRLGLAGLGSGAGSRTARSARTAGPPCCVDSPRTRLRSCCRSSCTRRGRSDTRWSDGCTHTLRRKQTKVLDLMVVLPVKTWLLFHFTIDVYACKLYIYCVFFISVSIYLLFHVTVCQMWSYR